MPTRVPTRPASLVVGELPQPDLHFGDVRDALTSLPEYGADGYATLDLFTVRAPLLKALDPTSVLEIGAYRGYFLVTALYACPRITHLGWVDNEMILPGSNLLCHRNVAGFCDAVGRTLPEIWYGTAAHEVAGFGHADVVQVDAAHGYYDCLTDLLWAESLTPETIFVDDYVAHFEVRHAADEFARWRGWHLEEYETVNGLAVLTKEENHDVV